MSGKIKTGQLVTLAVYNLLRTEGELNHECLINDIEAYGINDYDGYLEAVYALDALGTELRLARMELLIKTARCKV